MAEQPRRPLPSKREDRSGDRSSDQRHDWQPEDVQILEEGQPKPKK